MTQTDMTYTDKARADAVAFIGGGNMARSLIGGLAARGVPTDGIHVAEPVAALRDALRADFGVQVFEQAAAAADGAGTWVLAVKPQAMREVCAALQPLAQAQRPLVVSIAAGKTVWLDAETRMDAVTALSGSGPAYVFLLAEAMQAAGEAEGLSTQAARTLALETILGAARMLTEGDESAAELRRRVTSPGGTTQAAIETFEAGGFRELVADAIRAATERGKQLSAAND